MHVNADNASPKQKTKHPQLIQWGGIAAIVVALILIVIKLLAWLMSGSVSVLASLIDSGMDSAVSVVNFIAIRYALTPADDEHRFGHGKAEPIAGLVQAAIIMASAGFLLLHAVQKILHPQPIEHTHLGLIVMGVSLLLTIALVAFQKYVVRTTGSTAIEADSLHYTSDILATAAVIVALVAAQQGYDNVDAVLGLVIAVFIASSAWKIGAQSLRLLLDQELGPEVWEAVAQIANNNPDVRGYHQLRTRQSGYVIFIQLHLELDKHMPLLQAHAITEEVEQALRERYPNADVLIHTDPV